MRARWDDWEVRLSPRFIEALAAFTEAYRATMQEQDTESAECWTWDRAYVPENLAVAGIRFEFGSDEDLPDDGLGRIGVAARPHNIPDDDYA